MSPSPDVPGDVEMGSPSAWWGEGSDADDECWDGEGSESEGRDLILIHHQKVGMLMLMMNQKVGKVQLPLWARSLLVSGCRYLCWPGP